MEARITPPKMDKETSVIGPYRDKKKPGSVGLIMNENAIIKNYSYDTHCVNVLIIDPPPFVEVQMGKNKVHGVGEK